MDTCMAMGAEATIRKEGEVVIKERIRKSYRLPALDERLRGFRTRREVKILKRLEATGFAAPAVTYTDRKACIHMTFIAGPKLRDRLEGSDHTTLCHEIGHKVAWLHNEGIVHGDLTTSNIVLADELYILDFGLSLFSDKAEDMAVDLHILKRALQSKHHEIADSCFQHVLSGYRERSSYPEQVLRRLQKVEERGRNKKK